MKFKDYDENVFLVKRKDPKKVKDLNPNTLRMKTYKRVAFIKTEIPMEKRSFNNLPRYADKSSKVRFQDWLGIKSEKNPSCSIGKAECDGKWYGWSHRAVYGFGVGDVVKVDTMGNDTGKEYEIKTDDEAKAAAIAFAKEIA
jgi:hypothetical protein